MNPEREPGELPENNVFIAINEESLPGFFNFGVFIEDEFKTLYFGSLAQLADEWMLEWLMAKARHGSNALHDWYLVIHPADLEDMESKPWYKGGGEYD